MRKTSSSIIPNLFQRDGIIFGRDLGGQEVATNYNICIDIYYMYVEFIFNLIYFIEIMVSKTRKTRGTTTDKLIL